MKILLVHNYYSQRGGEDVYFDDLSKLFKEKGHKIIPYTKSSQTATGFGQKMSSLLSLFDVNNRIGKEINLLIKKERPDIAHFNNIYPFIGPAAYLACQMNDLPVIQTIHNYRLLPDQETSLGYDNYSSKLYKGLFRAAVELTIKKKRFDAIDCFIFPTKIAADIYLKNARFKIRNHEVIPNFVYSTNYATTPDRSDYFIYAGRFSKEKGVLPLLEIFARLPHYKLMVVGDGPLRKKVSEFKRYKNIKVYGWADKKTLFRLIRKSMALISPSLSFEVMPLSVIESLVLGTRVIVPKKGVFDEIIKDPRDGVFFKDNDFEDLSRQIVGFDRTQKVRTDYFKYYSPDKHLSSLVNLYKKLVGKLI